MARVSSKMSFTAAQISSVSTVTTSSSNWSRQSRKVSTPAWRTATPSAKRPDAIEHDPLARRQRRRHAGGVVGLDPDDLHVGAQELDEGRDPGREPAAADRHEHGRQRIGMLVQDLHPDRALAGDDVGIIVGVDEGQALLGLEFARMLVGLVETCRRAGSPARRGCGPPGP